MLTLEGDWCDRGTYATRTGMNGPQAVRACFTPGELPTETWKQACPVATCFEDWIKLLITEAQTSPLLWYRQQIVDAAFAVLLHASEMVTADYDYLLVPGTYPLPVDYPPDAGDVAAARTQGLQLAATLEESALDLLKIVAGLKPIDALQIYLDYIPKVANAADNNTRLVKTFNGIAAVVDIKTTELGLAERALLVLQHYTSAPDLHPTVIEAARSAYTKLHDIVFTLRSNYPGELDPIPTPPKPRPPTPSPRPLPSAPRAGMSTGAKVVIAMSVGITLGVLGYVIFGGRSEPPVQLRRRVAYR
jgi:hypothetical protein